MPRAVDTVAPFPWDALPRLDPLSLRAERSARRVIAAALDPTRLDAAIAEIIGAPSRSLLQSVEWVASGRAHFDPPFVRVGLSLSDGSAELCVGADATLAAQLLRRALNRPEALEDPSAPWTPALQGAFEGFLLEVARRTTRERGVAVVLSRECGPSDAALLVRGAVSMDGRSYAVGALVHPLRLPRPPLVSWERAFPVAVPLVAGICVADPSDMAQLAVGDAWSCGEGWMMDVRGVGSGLLIAPGEEVGVVVDVRADGSLVVRDETRQVPMEGARAVANDSNSTSGAVAMSNVAESPVVVRVEVGTVTLLAREWAALQAGDVIGTQQRIGDPVRLRIGGCEVARGELVDIDGELGVRISSLTDMGDR